MLASMHWRGKLKLHRPITTRYDKLQEAYYASLTVSWLLWL